MPNSKKKLNESAASTDSQETVKTATADAESSSEASVAATGIPNWSTESAETAAEGVAESYDFTVEDAGVKTDLDPELQKVLTALDTSREMDAALVQESDEGGLVVDVLAVLKDPQQGVPGLNIVSVIGDVVTGTLDIHQIEKAREDSNVISLKAARKISPHLHVSIPEIRARQSDIRSALQIGNTAIDGSGVIVGVVDFGCDFAHQNFIKPDGTTRLLHLWDQERPANSMSPTGFPYGREFSRADINAALQTPDPYTALGYRLRAGEHGTHVMDIAAGNGRGTGFPGVAPNADLIFVQLSTESGLESFGNSRRLLEAVQYIFRRAAELGRPAVVNLSLGTHGGPHDGSTPAERGFDFLLTERPGRAIVISAGNSNQRRSHAAGSLAPNQTRVLRWEIFTSDRTPNELEIWYNGSGRLEATLIAPNNQRVGTARVGETKNINLQNQLFAQIFNRAADPLNGDNQIDIFLRPGISGIWGIELRNVGQTPVNFHAWIERDDDNSFLNHSNQSKFVAADADSNCTIGSISCGKKTIVVGSYDAAVTNRDISPFSSSGPTRDGKQKPEISAPGQQIRAANSTSVNGTTVMSGTSMAAPHITGVVALLMQATGSASNLSIDSLREILLVTGRKSPQANNQSWNARYGTGRVDTVAAIGRLIPAAGGVTALISQANGNSISSATVGANSAIAAEKANKEFTPIKEMLELITGATSQAKLKVKLEVEVEPLLNT